MPGGKLQWVAEPRFAAWLGPRLAAADLVHTPMFGARRAAAHAVSRGHPAGGQRAQPVPELAANDRGDVAVAYLQRVRGGRRAVTLAERHPGGRFAAPRIVAGRGPGAIAVTVALGARGDLVVAWQHGRSVEAPVRRPGGRLGPVERLGSAVAQNTRLHAAVSRSGAVWVAWDAQLTTEGADNGPFTIASRCAPRAREPSGACA